MNGSHVTAIQFLDTVSSRPLAVFLNFRIHLLNVATVKVELFET